MKDIDVAVGNGGGIGDCTSVAFVIDYGSYNPSEGYQNNTIKVKYNQLL